MTHEEALQSVLMYCSEECGMIDACRCENKECVEAVVIKALKKQIQITNATTRRMPAPEPPKGGKNGSQNLKPL